MQKSFVATDRQPTERIFEALRNAYLRIYTIPITSRVIRDAVIHHPAIRVGGVPIRVSVVGLYFTTRPVTLLKSLDGRARHGLIVQLGNQSSDCLVGMIEP